jgi:hypothetical protein
MTESGEVKTCTTVFGGLGSVTRLPGSSHAAQTAAAATTADAFISAKRTESLKVNGMGLRAHGPGQRSVRIWTPAKYQGNPVSAAPVCPLFPIPNFVMGSGTTQKL